MPGTPEQLNQTLFAQVTTPGAGVLLVKLAGPGIGHREVAIITDIVVSAIDRQGEALRWLVLDFADVTFINSMGLGMCIDFRNRITKMGARAGLIGLNQQLLDLFKMVKVDRLFTIARDASDIGRKIAS